MHRRVQFQKGYSLTQFMDEYGSEEKCNRRCFVGVGRTGSPLRAHRALAPSKISAAGAVADRGHDPGQHEAAASHLSGDVPDVRPLSRRLSVSYNTAEGRTS